MLTLSPEQAISPTHNRGEADTLWANSGRNVYANNASANTLVLVKYIVCICDFADIDATLPVTPDN